MAQSRKISLCIPVVLRYDLLYELILSLKGSTIYPDTIYIIDNGANYRHLERAVIHAKCEVVTIHPHHNLGVAASWNKFIKMTFGERIICNDDITFAQDSILRILDTKGNIVSGLPGESAFSCFLIRDACIARVGYFDESISPGYAYFEDLDYIERMRLSGSELVTVDCGIAHGHSMTLKNLSADGVLEHHRKFLIAQTNFVNKWGYLPGQRQVVKPHR
jgi:GT2 family glycosyltransferase